MAEDPTIGELFKAKVVSDDEIAAAVDLFMREPAVSLFRFAEGYSLNVAAAVEAHPLVWARTIVANPGATEELRRAAVRTAILMARPQQE